MDATLKSQTRTAVQRYFLEFLQKFSKPTDGVGDASDFYYIEQAKNMVREDRKTLCVKMSHLNEIDTSTVSFEPADLRNVIESKYLMVREALNAAVPLLLATLEEPELQEKVQKARATDELKFTAAFYDLPTFCGLRSLKTERLGQLVTMCGTVTRTTEVKPELLVGTFQCNECSNVVSGVEQQFKVTFPTICPQRNCGNRTNWTLLHESRTTRWGDWQRVRLQENENEVPAGSMPRSMDVIVRDEMTERCKPGDKILVTGCLIVVPEVPSLMSPSELKQQVRRSLNTRTDANGMGEGVRGLKGLGNRDLNYKLAFFGGFVDEDGLWSGANQGESVRSDDKVFLSQSDKDRFMEISSHRGASGAHDCLDVLAKSISPAVHGHAEAKKGVLLMLIGGVPKKTDEGIKLRGDINVCICGDPATAKSSILKWTSKFLPRAVFASGKSSTAAGLTASVVRDQDLDNERIIEPGALMLADNGVCCIDEFELMDQKDQVAIHEAMEQQTITLSKAGIQATLMARASILAACLPKNTYYQPTQPLHKNVDITAPLMSRFDLFHVIQDIPDVSTDNHVADHILKLHRRNESEGSAGATSNLSQLDLQRYIRLARTVKPKVTPEAHQRLVHCYKKLREDRTFVRGASGVTVRQLESLLRLSEAVARVHLEDKITVEYVNVAFDLQTSTLKRVERENIDLNPDMPDEGAGGGEHAAEDGGANGGSGAGGDAARRRPTKMKISYNEYQRIGQMLAAYLARQEQDGEEVTEEDLIAWYMEQVEEEIQTEAQLFEQTNLVGLIISRLIDKDRVIIVYRQTPDASRPELRVLVKHPNFPVGDVIAGAQARA
jgi:DNA replication licensing factor MCM6